MKSTTIMKRVLFGPTLGVILLLTAMGFGPLCTISLATPIFPYPWVDYSVVPVLFCPTDWDIYSDEVQEEAAAIRSAMAEIQEFYAASLNGLTFRINDLRIVQALGPKEDYHIVWNGKNIYEDGVEFSGNMEHAVVNELHQRGFPTPPAQDESGYAVIMFVKGAGGFAGGREFPNADGGWAILGDWFIDSVQGEVPEGAYWWSGRRKQIGAAAHELGHTFNLPHPDAYDGEWSTTVMGFWWDYPGLGLNQWEIDYLMANKSEFFGPFPEALIGFVPIDFASSHNLRLQSKNSAFPEGDIELSSVPFQIPVGGDNVWGSGDGIGGAAGNNGEWILEVDVGVFGASRVYTLINTDWGTTESGRMVIEFLGSDGAYLRKDLIGNSDIRDWNLYPAFTTTINNTSTINVVTIPLGFDNNPDVMDMQIFALPADFRDETLTTIRVIDQRTSFVHSGLVSGITVFASYSGDLDHNGCVDRNDYNIIMADVRDGEPNNSDYDLNGDGIVNIADARYLATLFTNPRGVACQ